MDKLSRTPSTHTPRNSQGDPCPICHGVGWYALSVPVTDANFGKAIRCACQAESDAQVRHAALEAASSLTASMRRAMTFSEFDSTGYAGVWHAAISFVEEPRGWLVLWGGTGVGKTHLLTAIACALESDRTDLPLYVVASDLLRYLRAGMEAGSVGGVDRRLTLLREVDVLLLDDLGVEHSTEWAQTQLYDVLDYRYRQEAPTVIASNIPPDEWPFRLASRARDTRLSQVFAMVGDDYRLHR